MRQDQVKYTILMVNIVVRIYVLQDDTGSGYLRFYHLVAINRQKYCTLIG